MDKVLSYHLPEDPCHHLGLETNVLEEEAVMLLSEIEHNIRRLEGGQRSLREGVVHEHGDLAVGIASSETRGELGIGHDIDHMSVIVDAELLENDPNLLAVGRGKGVQLERSVPLGQGFFSPCTADWVDARGLVLCDAGEDLLHGVQRSPLGTHARLGKELECNSGRANVLDEGTHTEHSRSQKKADEGQAIHRGRLFCEGEGEGEEEKKRTPQDTLKREDEKTDIVRHEIRSIIRLESSKF